MQTGRNILYIFGGLVMLLPHSSCNKLTEKPYSSIFTDAFYATASDAEAGLTAVYGPMVDLYNTAGTFASDFSADQIYPRPVVGRDTYTLFSYDPNYTTQKSFSRQFESPQQIWQSCYSGIEKANWILYKVPATNMDTARRTAILGEAYYMRAFYLFTLTKNFRDVVVKTTPSISIDSAIIGKTMQADVFKQIFADLDQAVKKLPSYSTAIQKGRPSREVALALYAVITYMDAVRGVTLTGAPFVRGPPGPLISARSEVIGTRRRKLTRDRVARRVAGGMVLR